jgi:hypothetical protein
MSERGKSTRSTVVLLVCAMALLVGLTASAQDLQIVRTFSRPDGAYRVTLLRRPLPFAMPGQAGDAPGVVRLYDRTGLLLAEADVEMVQLVEGVDWSNDKASIKLIVEWDLARWPAAKPPPR